jgi:hypothetical protein
VIETPVTHVTLSASSTSTKLVGAPICPDLLEHSDLGAADNRRGQLVRAFFRILDRLLPIEGRPRG